MGAPKYKTSPKIFTSQNSGPARKPVKRSAEQNKRDKAEINRLKSLIQDKLKNKDEIKKAALLITLLLQEKGKK